MAVLKSLTPLLKANDIAETVRFYTEVLGFVVDSVSPPETPDFCSLDCGPVHLMFTTNGNYRDPPALTGHLYIYTDDVMGLHRRLAGRVDVLWGPEDYDYGMREFAIRDPNGYTLAFGEPLGAVS